MRKIEEAMLDAIRSGRNWRRGNTEVEHSPLGSVSVFLFGNCIYSRDAAGNVSTCQAVYYPTATTRSRLRALGINCRIYRGELIIE